MISEYLLKQLPLSLNLHSFLSILHALEIIDKTANLISISSEISLNEFNLRMIDVDNSVQLFTIDQTSTYEVTTLLHLSIGLTSHPQFLKNFTRTAHYNKHSWANNRWRVLPTVRELEIIEPKITQVLKQRNYFQYLQEGPYEKGPMSIAYCKANEQVLATPLYDLCCFTWVLLKLKCPDLGMDDLLLFSTPEPPFQLPPCNESQYDLTNPVAKQNFQNLLRKIRCTYLLGLPTQLAACYQLAFGFGPPKFLTSINFDDNFVPFQLSKIA